MRAFGERRGAIVLAEGIVGQHVRVGRQRIVDRDAMRAGRDLELGELGGAARLVARLRHHREDDLAVKLDAVRRRRSDRRARTGPTSFLPGMSAAVSTATTPGAARTAIEVDAEQLPGGDRRAADRDVQQCLPARGCRRRKWRCPRHASASESCAQRPAHDAQRAIPRSGGQAEATSAASPESDDARACASRRRRSRSAPCAAARARHRGDSRRSPA